MLGKLPCLARFARKPRSDDAASTDGCVSVRQSPTLRIGMPPSSGAGSRIRCPAPPWWGHPLFHDSKRGENRTTEDAESGDFGAIQGKIGRVGRLPEGISLLWRGAASIITLPLRKNRACGVVWDDFTRAQEQGTGTVPLPVRVRFPRPEFRTPSETGCVQACRL